MNNFERLGWVRGTTEGHEGESIPGYCRLSYQYTGVNIATLFCAACTIVIPLHDS